MLFIYASIICNIKHPSSSPPPRAQTCRAEGFVQVWEIQGGKHTSTLQLPYKVHTSPNRHHFGLTPVGQQCSSLVCPSSSSSAVVGTAKGSLCVVSLVDPSQPKLVLTRRMHSSAITSLRLVCCLGSALCVCVCVFICLLVFGQGVISTVVLWHL